MKKLSKSKKFKSKRSNSKKSSSNKLFLTLSLILLSSFAFISVIKATDPLSTCDPITGLNPDGTNIGCGYIPSNDVIDSSIITHDPLVTLPADSSTTTDSTTTSISTCDPATGLNPDGTNIGCSPPVSSANGADTTYQPITANESTAAHESTTNESTTAHEPTITNTTAPTHEDTAEKTKTKKKNVTTSAVNKVTEEHMSEVAKHVKILSETKDDKNGIGQEVKEIAGAQDASQIRIAEKLAKMHAKNIWLKKIAGYDHEAVSSIQEEMAEIRLRIQEIHAIQEQTTNKEAMSQLEDAANALIEQNAALDDSLQEEMHNVGVWGWFENLIKKSHDAYSVRFGS